MNSINWRNATPEQYNLYQYAWSLAAFTSRTPKVVMAPVAGTEYLTYDAAHLYVALDLRFSVVKDTTAIGGHIILYDKDNAVSAIYVNQSLAWDGAADKFERNTVFIKNVYFSRIEVVGYTYIHMNGYLLHV